MRTGRLVPLGVLGLVALGVFGADLGASSLFGDEAASLGVVHGATTGLVSRLDATEIAPPLFYVVLKAWTVLVGGGDDAVLRLPSLAFSVGAVVAVACLTSLLTGRRRALVAA